jgi:hypothetical protein
MSPTIEKACVLIDAGWTTFSRQSAGLPSPASLMGQISTIAALATVTTGSVRLRIG